MAGYPRLRRLVVHRPVWLWAAYLRYRLGVAEPSPLKLLRLRWVDAHHSARARLSHAPAPRPRPRLPEAPYETPERIPLPPVRSQMYMRMNPDGVRVYDWDFPQTTLFKSLEEAEQEVVDSEDRDGLSAFRAALARILRR